MNQQVIRWCAIGDSFTYLNDHLDETLFRLKKGYLTRILDKLPDLVRNRILKLSRSMISDLKNWCGLSLRLHL